jgi:hypothetical protein
LIDDHPSLADYPRALLPKAYQLLLYPALSPTVARTRPVP